MALVGNGAELEADEDIFEDALETIPVVTKISQLHAPVILVVTTLYNIQKTARKLYHME